MNKIWTLALMALLTAGFAACSDSDDENNGGGTTPETKHELTEAQLIQREAVASVLSQLTGETFSDTADVDFEGRTYNMTNASELREYTFHYTNTDDFNRFAEYSIIYTVRGIAFNTAIPEELTKVNI